MHVVVWVLAGWIGLDLVLLGAWILRVELRRRRERRIEAAQPSATPTELRPGDHSEGEGRDAAS